MGRFTRILGKLTCPVCYEIPRKGGLVLCQNNHRTCEFCHMRLALPKSCPVCRCDFQKTKDGQLQKCRLAKTVLSTIEIPCRFRESGCRFEKTRKRLLQHEVNCEFRAVPCKYAYKGCKLTFSTADRIKHENDCVYQTIPCPYSMSCHLGALSMVKMANHLVKAHRTSSVNDNNCYEMLDMNNNDSFSLQVMQSNGKTFLAAVIYLQNTIKAYMIFLGPLSKARDTKVNIDLIKTTNDGQDNVAMSYQGPATQADVSWDVSSGLVIQKSFLELDEAAKIKFGFEDNVSGALEIHRLFEFSNTDPVVPNILEDASDTEDEYFEAE